MATYYWTSGTYQAAYSTATSTTLLNDGSAGDTSTYIQTSGSGGPSPFTAFYDNGSAVTCTSFDITWWYGGDLNGTILLEGSTNSTSWTTIATSTLSGSQGSFHRWQPSGNGSSYRYYRLSVETTDDGSLGTHYNRISDWRFISSISLTQTTDFASGYEVDTGSTVTQPYWLRASSIASAEAFQAGDVVAQPDWLIEASSIASAENVPAGMVIGAPLALYQPNWISDEAVGQPSLSQGSHTLIQTASIGSAEAFQSGDALARKSDLFAFSIPSAENVVGGSVVPAPVILYPLSILSAEAFFFSSAVIAEEISQTAGIVSGEAFGGGSIARGMISHRRNPFLPVTGPQAAYTSAEMASLTGMPQAVFDAFNESIPYWDLERRYRSVANALGVDPEALRAVISGAKKKIVGRQMKPTGSQATQFGGLKHRA